MQRPSKSERDKYLRKVVSQGVEVGGKTLSLMPPCGCIVELAPCKCQDDACSCDLEIDVVDPDLTDCVCEDKDSPCECRRCYCEWTEAQSYEFRAAIFILLSTLDPETYADLPPPLAPLSTISKEARIEHLEHRLASGHGLYHPRDRNVDDCREGDIAKRGMNGAAVRTGKVGSVEGRHQARWAKEASPRKVGV